MAVAGGLIANTLARWNHTQGLLTTTAQAREVLDRLEQDLQGAHYRDNGKAWLMATVQAETSVSGLWVNGTKPAAASLNHTADRLADSRFGLAGTWLRFFTTATAGSGSEPRAPVAVSYQIVRRAATPGSEQCHYLLYRSEVTSPATFDAGYNLTANEYTTGCEVSGTPGTVVTPAVSQLLANNVIDFGVRFYARLRDDSTGVESLQPIFPRHATELEFSAQSSATAGPGQKFPAVVDIFLRVLTDEGDRRIAALESGRISGNWWTIAEANSRVFLRRIQLRSEPP